MRVKYGEGRPAQSRGWTGSSPAPGPGEQGSQNLGTWEAGGHLGFSPRPGDGDSGTGKSQLWERGGGYEWSSPEPSTQRRGSPFPWLP